MTKRASYLITYGQSGLVTISIPENKTLIFFDDLELEQLTALKDSIDRIIQNHKSVIETYQDENPSNTFLFS